MLNTILVAVSVFIKLASLSKLCWHVTCSNVRISNPLCCPICIQDARNCGGGGLLLFIFNFSSEYFQEIQEELELKNIYQPLV